VPQSERGNSTGAKDQEAGHFSISKFNKESVESRHLAGLTTGSPSAEAELFIIV